MGAVLTLNLATGPEFRAVSTTNGTRYQWRHPAVRDGMWSRPYLTKQAAQCGMGLALRHRHRKQSR